MKSLIKIFSFLLFLSTLLPQQLNWSHLGGPMGGAIGDIAINSKGHIYAGTYSAFFYYYAGLYKSTDNGETWNKIKSLPYNIEVYALFINKEDHIFAGTRGQGVIYRSTDDGETWEIKASGFTSPHCWAFGQNKEGSVLVAGEAWFGRTYRSTDNGDSWTYTAPLSGISFAVDSINNIYCGTFDGLYKSTNDGLTWDPTGLTNVPVNAILIDSSNGVICGTGYYTNGQGVFYSTDYGATWTNIGLAGKIIYSLAFTGYGSLLAGSDRNGVYETTDMGGSWEQHSNGLYRKDIFRLKVNENDDIITGSEYEGIFRSLNRGESFEHVGLPISRVNNIVFYEDNLIIAATPSGVQKYNRLTYKWENIGLHNVNAVDVDKTGSIYAGTDGEGLFYLRETGGEWINISQTPYILNVKKLNETILAATTDYLIRSTDEGNTWENTPVNSGVDNNAIEINNNGDVWAVGFQKLFKSTDDGLTFSSISLNFRYVDRNNLYVNDSLVFLGDLLLGKGIHYSTDYASTWQNKYHHRGTFSVSGNNNYVIYGTPEDIFFTIDKGLTWDSIPYPNNFYGIVIEIEFDKNGQLFFGTSSQGLFEMDFVVSIEDDPPINKDFYLSQNYPNPFNPTTNISYSISQRSFVTLKIYDVLGIEVTTLINKEVRAGSYEVEFDANNLPSGIYFYQIRAGAFVDTKKLVLMK